MRARRSTLRPVRRVAVQRPSAAPQTCASRISTRSRRAGPTRRSARTRAAPRYAPPCIRSVGRGAAVAVQLSAVGCIGWGLALESRGGIPRTAEPDRACAKVAVTELGIPVRRCECSTAAASRRCGGRCSRHPSRRWTISSSHAGSPTRAPLRRPSLRSLLWRSKISISRSFRRCRRSLR